MAAVSQTLIDFARRVRSRPAPGQTWDANPKRLLRFQPSSPIAGPNLCAEVRTTPERLGPLIEDVRARFRERGLPVAWVLDEDSRPADLGERLTAAGFLLDSEAICMVLPTGSGPITADPAIEIGDALKSLDDIRIASTVAALAFGDPEPATGLEARYAELRAQPDVHMAFARLGGEIAGSGIAEITPAGTMLRGGSVHPRLRGRGVYRALLAARQRLSEEAASPGLATQARVESSAPILLRLGFTPVGTRRFFRDLTLPSASAR